MNLSLYFTALAFLLPLQAQASLDTVLMDFGNPADLLDGAPGVGESGTTYFTVTQSSNFSLRNLVLSPVAGECVAAVAGMNRVSLLEGGQTLRLPSPVSLTMADNCQLGDPARILLLGAYEDSVGERKRIWSEVLFSVGMGLAKEFSFEFQEISLPIQDAKETPYFIDILPGITIEEIGIGVQLRHAYVGDLSLKLIHPDGTEVVLQDQKGGSNDDLDMHWGFGGSNVAEGDLSQFHGKLSRGKWQLLITDHQQSDAGTLDRVIIKLK